MERRAATEEGRGAAEEPAAERRPAARGVDRERQYESYGGVAAGAVFFGWLAAIAVSVLLIALLAAAGAAIGLTELNGAEAEARAEAEADTLSIVGGALLVAVLVLGYFAGGYVAGRMSRFDGTRQGFGVWALGLVITLLFAALGAIAGAEYNIFAQLNLPRLPVDEGSLATGGIIALLLILVGTALAAVAGGRVGENYHRKVDRAGTVAR